MRRVVGFLFILYFLVSCSSSSGPFHHRSPASVTESSGCYEIASQIVSGQKAFRSQQLQRLKSLDTQWVDDVPQLKELVYLNRSPKLRKRSRQIMSLLKKKYPEEQAPALARRYRRLFKECA